MKIQVKRFFSFRKCQEPVRREKKEKKEKEKSQEAELFRKSVFSNKINKPGRRHNRLNRRNRQGKFSRQTLISELVIHAIWYCLYRAFVLLPLAILPGRFSVFLFGATARYKTCCNAMLFPGNPDPLSLTLGRAVSLGVIISGRGTSCLQTFTT